MFAVRPEFGPTLPQLLANRTKAWRNGLIAFYVLVLAVTLYLLLLRPDPNSHKLVSRGAVTFSFNYDGAFKRVAPQGNEQVRLQGTRGRLVAVTPLELPSYSGTSDAFLPQYAERLAEQMAPHYRGFQLRTDGRPSVNRFPGYEFVFQYQRDGKTSYGRRLLLLNSYASDARKGVDVLLLENRSKVVPVAESVGTTGSLMTLLRSFAFGTRPV